MRKKTVSRITLSLLLTGISTLAFSIQPIRASGTIYIRSDGSVEGTDKIQRDGHVYTFTGNINESIVVERDNIVVDGAGYALQGTGSGIGINMTWRSNVTLKNVEVTNFEYGIFLYASYNNTLAGNIASSNDIGIRLRFSWRNVLSGNTASNNRNGILIFEHSNNNNLTGNNVSSNFNVGISVSISINNVLAGNIASSNDIGIYLSDSSNNTLSGNTATSNNDTGIWVEGSSNNNVLAGNTASNNQLGIELYESGNNNTLAGNTASNNEGGIVLISSSNNNLTGNTASSNNYGIFLYNSSNNALFHNNFIDNTNQVYSENSINTWDDGYPSGGNYWSDYEEKYPNAEEIDGTGIWDTPYVIDENNQDNYPIVPEFPTWTSMLLILIVLTVAIAIYKRRLLKTPTHRTAIFLSFLTTMLDQVIVLRMRTPV